MNDPQTTNEIRMDASNLYRESTFSDNRIGTIRRMQPVTAEGEHVTSIPRGTHGFSAPRS